MAALVELPRIVQEFRAARSRPDVAVLEGFHAVKHAVRFGARLDRDHRSISETHAVDPAYGKRKVQSGRCAKRIWMPRIVVTGREDASGVPRGRDPYARAHVLKIPRVFEQDYRTRRGVKEQLSHLDLGALGDTHDPGSRCAGSQDRKDIRRDDLKLRGEASVHVGSEHRG